MGRRRAEGPRRPRSDVGHGDESTVVVDAVLAGLSPTQATAVPRRSSANHREKN